MYILESAIHKYCSSSNGHLPSLYCDLKPQTCSAKYFEVNKNTVYSMPTMTFSFVCHTAVLPIYAELGGGEGQEKGMRISQKCWKVRKTTFVKIENAKIRGKVKRMLSVAATSIGSCFTLYFLASLFGYLTFFNYVQSELLMTYSHTDPTNALTIIVRCCVLIGECSLISNTL